MGKNDIKYRPFDEKGSKEWFNNYCNIVEQNQKVMQEIIETDEYVEWLSAFMSTHDYFSTDEEDYDLKVLESDDLENINKFYCFYKVVENYANCNYILSIDDELGFVYYVRYNGVIYKIGSYNGGESFYCKKVGYEDLKDVTVIDYNDVLKYQNNNFNPYLRDRLLALADLITELRAIGVTEQVIKSSVDETLKLIK